MSCIREGLKKIFSDENAIIKHLVLFVLTGVMSMFALPINELSKQKFLTPGQWWFTMIAVILCALVGLYVSGYIYEFVHKQNSEESGLPDFNIRHILKGLKFLPVTILWLLYFGLMLAGCIVVGMFSKIASTVLFILICLLFILWLFLFPMLVVEYSKEFKIKGLFSFIKPFTYVKEYLGHFAILIAKLLPIIIILFVLNYIATNNRTVLGYLVASLWGYLSFIYSMVLFYSYNKISKIVCKEED